MTDQQSQTSACCACSRGSIDRPPVPAVVTTGRRSTRRQTHLPGGTFQMGDHFNEGYPGDGETPVHAVRIDPFWMDDTSVTNAQFATFAKMTGYVTDAERYETSAVFHSDVCADPRDVLGRPAATPWWVEVRGANWRHPEGPLSDVSRRQNHPVVHVSHNDAAAYAAWAGKRLPTEAEWEFAARGGLEGTRFPWGDELRPRGKWLCNIFQGNFPERARDEVGRTTTSPARAFHQNGYGLWNMIGNVWEWCSDWFSPTTYADRSVDGGTVSNPPGPTHGEQRVIRGGSFLCHDSYCYRYRLGARSSNTPDSSSSNMGFRCANDHLLPVGHTDSVEPH